MTQRKGFIWLLKYWKEIVLVVLVMGALLYLLADVFGVFDFIAGIASGAGTLMASAVPDLGSLMDFGMGSDDGGDSCENPLHWETLEINRIQNNPANEREPNEAVLTFNQEVDAASTQHFIEKVSDQYGIFIDQAWVDGDRIVINLHREDGEPSAGEMLTIETKRTEGSGIISDSGCTIRGSCEAPYMEGEAQCDVSSEGDNGGDTNMMGDDGQDSDANDGGQSNEDNQQDEPEKYDVYFVPLPGSYGNEAGYEIRADRLAQTIVDKTPFQECSNLLNVTVWNSRDPPDANYDLLVEVSNYQTCNAMSDGPAGEDRIVVHGDVGEMEDTVLPHEMGHEFGLCDLYSDDAYQCQEDGTGCNDPGYPAVNGHPGGCGNSWSDQWLWSPANQCTQLPTVHGNSPISGCGESLIKEETRALEDRQASIMGGAGSMKITRESSSSCQADECYTCHRQYIEQPRFTDEAYSHFKMVLNNRLQEKGIGTCE